MTNSKSQNTKKFGIWNFNNLEFRISNFRQRQGGYIALIALLIVAAAGLTIGLAVSFSGIDEIKTSFSLTQAAKAKSLASACAEDGLERLRQNWNNYSASLSINGNSCIINTVADINNATISALGTVDIYTQKIQVQVDNNFNVISWQEE
ncbi:MAG: hypothetical protein WC508_04835 [Patescibacteria group bacterium]